MRASLIILAEKPSPRATTLETICLLQPATTSTPPAPASYGTIVHHLPHDCFSIRHGRHTCVPPGLQERVHALHPSSTRRAARHPAHCLASFRIALRRPG